MLEQQPMPRNPDRELDGTNTEDFPTGKRYVDLGRDGRPVAFTAFDLGRFEVIVPEPKPERRIASVRRAGVAVRFVAYLVGTLALVGAGLFALAWGLR